MMKKICFVTAARSEYGLLKWIMRAVNESEDFQLQIIVTGGHLLKKQGHTIDEIKKDGFNIDMEVDIQLDVKDNESIAASMGRIAEGMAHAFATLEPDYLAVLGDRYELLPICNTAFIMGIPIIHISGGDVTEGVIDDGVRNAVTMLSTYHFPGTQGSAENIRRMRNQNDCIWIVGEPGLELFRRESLTDRKELARDIGLDVKSDWVLLTYHPETKESIDFNLKVVDMCCTLLIEEPDLQVVATYSNADVGGEQINELLEGIGVGNKEKFKVVSSLGARRYLSLMKQVKFVIGNSSSGIVEAPSIGVHVINIGSRQKGRHLCSNVIQCAPEIDQIKKAITAARTREVDLSEVDYWGDGNVSERILQTFRERL